jgi:multiple sugar transport system permease protein
MPGRAARFPPRHPCRRIGPTVLLVSIPQYAGFFQLFAEPLCVTQGGPAQSTGHHSLLHVREGFKWWNLGIASAVA